MYRCRYLCVCGHNYGYKNWYSSNVFILIISGLSATISVATCCLLIKSNVLSAWPTLMCRLAIP